MKRLFLFLAIHLFIVQSWAFPIKSMKCQGGDGPNPLTDLSELQKSRITVYDTKGTMGEFVLWEGKRAIAYRNSRGEVYQLNLTNGVSHGLARTQTALSRVKDEDEKFLTLQEYPVTLDTSYSPPQWWKWSHHQGLEHLYWHSFLGRDTLFSISSKKHLVSDQQRIEVYSFSRRGVKPHLCNLMAKKGQHYHLGEGHVYPNIFLYRTEKQGDCTRLSYFNIQIEGELLGKPRCELYSSGQYSTLIPGNVLEVYQFPTLMQGNHNMFVVRTDHPDKNLLWDDGVYGCRFYQFGNYQPIILNPKQAVLAVWTEEEGLSLIYPRKLIHNEPVILRPLGDLIRGPIQREHLALSDNGRELYVSAYLKNGDEKSGRKLIKIDLDI